MIHRRYHLVFLLLLSAILTRTDAQSLSGGLFPAVVDLSSFKPVTTTSTCGLNNNQMTYCISSTSSSSLDTCTQRTCLHNCCDKCSTSKPVFTDIDKSGVQQGKIYVSADRRPGSETFSNSLQFYDGQIIRSNIPAAFNLSFAVWVKQEDGNEG